MISGVSCTRNEDVLLFLVVSPGTGDRTFVEFVVMMCRRGVKKGTVRGCFWVELDNAGCVQFFGCNDVAHA